MWHTMGLGHAVNSCQPGKFRSASEPHSLLPIDWLTGIILTEWQQEAPEVNMWRALCLAAGIPPFAGPASFVSATRRAQGLCDFRRGKRGASKAAGSARMHLFWQHIPSLLLNRQAGWHLDWTKDS